MSVKRILYCEGNTDGTIGGSYYSLLYLTSGLDKNKYKPIVLFYTNNALIKNYNEAGIETEVFTRPTPFNIKKFLPVDSPFLKPVSPLLKIFQSLINFNKFFIATSLRYAAYLKKHKIDMVHLNNAISRSDDWKLAARIAGIKCVCHERGINASYPAISLKLAKKMDAIFCISHAVRNNMLSQGFDPELLQMVHNGIDPQKVIADATKQEMLARHNIEKHKIIVGMVGNVKSWKGQEVVIKAISIVKQKYPDVCCLLVGDVSPLDQGYYDRITALVNELQLKDDIIFTGYQKNVANYLNVMEIVIHASTDPEPFGRVLIEAMSMKKPLIGSASGAVPEIIDNEKTGYIFEPGNHEQLAEKLMELLGNMGNAAKMGERGFDRLNEEFHIDQHVKKVESVYSEIFAR